MLLIDPTIALAFITTFFFVSATPGMCMALSFSLGMSIGVKRLMPMVFGELIGVGLVTILCGISASSIMKYAPEAYSILKYFGGAYLIYIAYTMWRDSANLERIDSTNINRKTLFMQGFVTATTNPKAWAFMSTVLLPFIDPQKDIIAQLSLIVTLILFIEFLSLLAYALAGQSLKRYIAKDNKRLILINRIAALCIAGIGVWLLGS